MTAKLTPLRKKARLMAACLRGRPVWCTWQLTPRCGAHCAFCEHRLEGGIEEATTRQLRTVAGRLDEIGTMVISLSGGEPFLRDDLPAIVDALATNHFVLLTSHGLVVTEVRARTVWEAGLDGASILLEDSDPARHDDAVGVPGAFARAVAAAECLARTRVRAGQQVNLKTRVSPERTEHLAGILDLAERLGITVSVEAAFPVGEGVGRGRLSERLAALKKTRPALRTRPSVLARMDEAFGAGVPGCLAAKAFLNVDHLGRVSRCPEYRPPSETIGDLRSGSGSDWLGALGRVHRENRCRRCFSGSRAEVEAVYSLRGVVALLPDLLRS